jgi:hypothetical protein
VNVRLVAISSTQPASSLHLRSRVIPGQLSSRGIRILKPSLKGVSESFDEIHYLLFLGKIEAYIDLSPMTLGAYSIIQEFLLTFFKKTLHLVIRGLEELGVVLRHG